MTFPVESIPDGHVVVPHHLYIGLLLAFALWVVPDDFPRHVPLLAMAGLLVALLAFALTWKWYPATGAALTLAGVALVGELWPGGMWNGYPLRWSVLALLGVVIAADDVVSHAFGWWTPLDAGWGQVYHLVS